MDPAEYQAMYEVEDTHAWFRAKREMLLLLLKKFSRPGAKILDVGCGTGVIASALAKNNAVVGLDISAQALAFARKRDASISWIKGDAQAVKFKPNSFDVVLASDVVEHVKDDVKALENMHRVLKPGGKVIITVPALEMLWGRDDDLVHHQRRYTRSSLKRVLRRAGFKVDFLNYWNVLLFPAVLVYKWRNKEHSVAPVAGIMNKLAFGILKLDTWLIRHVWMPFGVSLVVVASKK
ncbi:MAG: class I SAM-dependent methyltransferase [Nanoarchaeota archaeon]|nr:class I SAM-dependent methyltransferase [Nanoarchaeota archaeon]